MENNLAQILIDLHERYPNNMEFGNAVRLLTWNLIAEQKGSDSVEQMKIQFSNDAN
jgi:hypothetical protein